MDREPDIGTPAGVVGSAATVDRRLRWIEVLADGLILGVLVQAVLAGQILTGRHWMLTAHRVIAEGLPLLALALVVLAWEDWRARPARPWVLMTAIAAFGVLVTQTGLGFVGRSSSAAIGVHIPLGVALLGLYVVLASGVRGVRREERQWISSARPERSA
jgi:hypothetical protein